MDRTGGAIEWIPISLTGLIILAINSFILRKEYKIRKVKSITFTTKGSKFYSICCIICGVLYGMMVFVKYFNIFCHFAEQLLIFSFAAQSVFMGFYQLDRLYYCFAQTQIYSNKGYPNWLFIVMFMIGIFVIFICSSAPWFGVKNICGINNQFQYYWTKYYRIPSSIIATGLTAMVYLLWDSLTLILYIIKVIPFKKYSSQKEIQYKRILSTLNRVLILTIMYQIMGLMVGITTIINGIMGINYLLYVSRVISSGLSSIMLSYSMYLMQQHNTRQYRSFLKILYQVKLHYICCCCCKSIIDDEIKSLQDDMINYISPEMHDVETRDDTALDPSIKIHHSVVKQLSIDTVSEQGHIPNI